ncbi:hypothetical protein [Pseudoalteromonas spongiae]|uniref:hypothetical protein n=1 Tax=Pseudoalteromonas spongiae TaxID=298657 RepID=UPI000C2CFD67|nr:hypothetical protein [Pseudoalteromonas spongiae]
MTTLAQIKKIAKPWFIPEMKERGFSQNSKATLTFFREAVDGIYHFISFDILSSGENLRVNVFAWVPEINATYDFSQFPKKIGITNGGGLRDNDINIGHKYWKVRDEAEIINALKEILLGIDKIAIPWLDSVDTREELLERFFIDAKNRDNFQERKVRILSKSLSNLDN